jgi:hypothetical protein
MVEIGRLKARRREDPRPDHVRDDQGGRGSQTDVTLQAVATVRRDGALPVP